MRPILFVAVMIGVACVLNSIDANSLTCPAAPESRSLLARLDRELLKPPPPFDCGFKANVSIAVNRSRIPRQRRV